MRNEERGMRNWELQKNPKESLHFLIPNSSFLIAILRIKTTNPLSTPNDGFRNRFHQPSVALTSVHHIGRSRKKDSGTFGFHPIFLGSVRFAVIEQGGGNLGAVRKRPRAKDDRIGGFQAAKDLDAAVIVHANVNSGAASFALRCAQRLGFKQDRA